MIRTLLTFSINQKNNTEYHIDCEKYSLRELFNIWYCLTFNKPL